MPLKVLRKFVSLHFTGTKRKDAGPKNLLRQAGPASHPNLYSNPGRSNMRIKKPNAELVLKQIDDVLVARLRLSLTDRVVYLHLLRHSRLEGKRQLRFSISWLARGAHISGGPARDAVRRLASKGALRMVETRSPAKAALDSSPAPPFQLLFALNGPTDVSEWL